MKLFNIDKIEAAMSPDDRDRLKSKLKGGKAGVSHKTYQAMKKANFSDSFQIGKICIVANLLKVSVKELFNEKFLIR